MARYTRRWALRRTGLLLGVGLAGCLGGDEGTPTRERTPGGGTPTETRTGRPTADGTTESTDRPTATGTEPSAGTPGAVQQVAPAQEGVGWRVDLGAGIGAPPAVADGTVYVGGWRETEGTPTPGAGPGAGDRLYALDLASGDARWQYTSGPVQRRPRVVGDTVYVVRGFNGLHGHGYQVRALTTGGDERWRHEAPDGKFLAVLGADESGIAVGTHDDYLSGGEERVTDLMPDGDVRWEERFVDVRGGTVDPGTVYASAYENRVRAYDRESGDARWTFETVQTQPGDPLSVIGNVVVPGVKLWGLDRTSGDTRWTVDREVRGVVTDGATLYGSTVGGTLLAVGPADGTVQWERSVDADFASVAAAGGTLYVGRSDGVLEARGAETGDRQWRVEVGGAVRPVLAGDRVYAHRAEEGAAVALAASDGTRQQSFEFEGGHSALVPGEGTDVATTDAGQVYGLTR